MLESALARAQQKRQYDPSADLATLAAAYAFGLARNHPFADGNKRAALVTAYTFLAINEFELVAPEPETVSMVIGLAEGSISEDDFATWIRSRLIPWAD